MTAVKKNKLNGNTLMTGMISLETYHGSTVSIICENSVLQHTPDSNVRYNNLQHTIKTTKQQQYSQQEIENSTNEH